MKKNFCFIVLFAVIMALSVSLSAEAAVKVTLRIEGVDSCVYEGVVELPADADKTVASLLSYAASSVEGLTFTGIEDSYITAVNGEAAAIFGGWDGWLFTLNGVPAAAGIADTAISDGDTIVLYYGDPFGVGMQYPEADFSDIASGKLAFYSNDTVYDESYNPVVSRNPVAGMTVTLGSSVFTTNEKGIIDISSLPAGTYRMSIEKKAENGLPLVLRFSEAAELTVPELVSPSTDEGFLLPWMVLAIVSAIILVSVCRKHEA